MQAKSKFYNISSIFLCCPGFPADGPLRDSPPFFPHGNGFADLQIRAILQAMENHAAFYLLIVWNVLLLAAVVSCILDVLHSEEEEPDRRTFWLVMLLSIPVAGILLYMLVGRSRRDTVGRRIAISSVNFRRRLMHCGKLHENASRLAAFITPYSGYGAAAGAFRMIDRMLPETCPLGGNDMHLLHDGTAAYPAMLEAIRSARETICLQSFIIANDDAGRRLFDALAEKARQGVRIRVLYDRFGSLHAAFTNLFVKYNRNVPNFTIRPFSLASSFKQWNFQLRNHRKLLVVDSRVAFLGGINISADNLRKKSEKYIHDLHCRVEGPAVLPLLNSFLRDWFYACPKDSGCSGIVHPPVSAGDGEIRVLNSGFGQLYGASGDVFYAAAASAARTLWIISPYFVPDSQFTRSLELAAARGVDVRIIVPALNNHFYVKWASRSLYGELLSAGVRIFERQKVFVHTKAMLVDSEWGMIGSSNCDVRSFRLNLELDIVVRGNEILNELNTEFRRELSSSREISLHEVFSKPGYVKVAENLCSVLIPVL